LRWSIKKRPRLGSWVLVLFLFGAACTLRESLPTELSPGSEHAQWSPEHRYAGEMLSYMMQVVLGRAGDSQLREDWRNRGLTVPMDWYRISEQMARSGVDKHALMVMDPNLLGLSHILYRYDPRLNQFKGKMPFFSPYPSTGLIALRLLLLQKMNRSETIRLEAVLHHRELLRDPERPISQEACRQMKLRPDEARLLQGVFSDCPELFAYLEHPFVVDVLHRMGAVEDSLYTRTASRYARYTGIPMERRILGADDPAAVSLHVAILFSFTDAFLPQEKTEQEMGARGLCASEDLRSLVSDMEEQIYSAVASGLPEGADGSIALAFSRSFARPLAVSPANFTSVAESVCPDADYVMVLLGKDVYRSFDFGVDSIQRLTARRAFLDVTDVAYGLWTADLAAIGDALRARWKESRLR
jgi:hypothetical protein